MFKMSKNKFSTHYSCVCNKSYSQKRQIRQHVSLCKYAQNPTKKDMLQLATSKCKIYSINDELSANKVQSAKRFKCGCEKRFKSKGGYYKHIKQCKLCPEQQVVTGNTKCNEPGCSMTFKYIRDFRKHLNEKHQLQFDVEDRTFDKYTDFLNWKVKYESETHSYFYHRKNLTCSRHRVEYWYCNRSGSYQSSLKSHKRKLKSQGILKINNNCTSSITVTVNTDDTVQAVVYHTHYGHKCDLVHLRILKSDKQEVAFKLSQGVRIEDILLSYNIDGSSEQTEQNHLIRRRNILNVSEKYNVKVKNMYSEVQSSKKKINYEFDQETIKPIIIDNLSSTVEANKRHLIASQLSLSLVNPIDESIWRISVENNLVPTHPSIKNAYVTKNYVLSCSSEDCTSYCNYCDICYHAYYCNCPDYKLKKIICKHIHLAILFQANSQTCQYENHIERSFHGIQDHTDTQDTHYNQNCIETIKISQLINNVRLNNQSEKLKNIKVRLEKLMMDTIVKINECNNIDLLETLEKQITNTTRNLGLENTVKKRNEIQTMLPGKNIEVYCFELY
ncbi:hypothetical protein AGLY_002433 [Aphis glycines]|uniref:SWIM-type domain-containing protein n=1 Tax=Aphis glycines TaxID=307491 RepID=A0A6G0U3W7_APHGL|nr:hypothetical protein AGLY_002433 [Aphis glycines]